MDFCTDPIFDLNQTWFTAKPRLSPCMIHGILPGVPTAFLWISFAPWLWLNWRNRQSQETRSRSSLDLLKRFLNALVIVNLSFQLTGSNRTPLEGLYVSLLIPTLTLAILVLLVESYCRRMSSPILTTFWLTLALASIPTFVKQFQDILTHFTIRGIFVLVTFEPVIILTGILNCFADQRFNSGNQCSKEETSSWFSNVFFYWVNCVVWNGARGNWSLTDLPTTLPFNLRSSFAGLKLRNSLNQRKGFWTSLLWPYVGSLILPTILAFVYYTLSFAQPQILKLLILHFQDELDFEWHGLVLAIGLFVLAFVSSLIKEQISDMMIKVGIQMKSALLDQIYHKALTSKGVQDTEQFSIGDISSFLTVDAERIYTFIPYFQMVWSVPYQVLGATAFLYLELGPAALAGLATLILMIPISGLASKKLKNLQEIEARIRDKRIKMTVETISGIKVIKINAWERPYIRRIQTSRLQEINLMRQTAFPKAISSAALILGPHLFIMVVFGIYVSTSNAHLTYERVFVSLALLGLMKFPIMMYKMVLSEGANLWVSIQRIKDYLELENNFQQNTPLMAPIEDGNALSLKKATIYSAARKTLLKNVDIKFPQGSLTMIQGATGSGKSSLLASLARVKSINRGYLQQNGTIAFVPQSPWIQDKSFKENIVFGGQINDRFYQQVLEGCALLKDLESFEFYDDSIVGENGSRLSGGQKQRLALARAVYQRRDIYLVDDPLSSLDELVRNQVFSKVFSSDFGLLQNSTRIMVTNQTDLLKYADQVILLENGTVHSTWNKRTKLNPSVLYPQLYKKPTGSDVPTRGSDSSKELAVVGPIKMRNYWQYLRHFGHLNFAVSLLLFITIQFGQTGGSIWLAKWTEVAGTQGLSEHMLYLGIFGFFGIVMILASILKDLLFINSCAKASTHLHTGMVEAVSFSPMRFFENNPIGRIVNRFTQDLAITDQAVPTLGAHLFWATSQVVAVLIVICLANPFLALASIPFGLVYYMVQKVYIASSRQLKRLEALSKSQVLAHFNESWTGKDTIVTFHRHIVFESEFQGKVDTNALCFYVSQAINRWLGLVMANIGSVSILVISIVAVIERGAISVGLASLAITFSFQLSENLIFMVRMICELEKNFVSVERVLEYCNLPMEPIDRDDNRSSFPRIQRGTISFEHVGLKYISKSDFSLKNLCFNVRSQEKFGIIGRTGAGKSSIISVLFRLENPTVGRVLLDGQDIMTMPLSKLRRQMAIIPQDPLIFSGSIRFNLDPDMVFADIDLWTALEAAEIHDLVRRQPGGLEAMITGRPDQFSAGQRQLFCVARAILKRSKIVILDEVTSLVDHKTEAIIRRTIQTQFKNCTTISVSHKREEWTDFDRIMTLDEGVIQSIVVPSEPLFLVV
ncbi:hypothetical protein TCAL_13931 [Tigriopus californicus]|uniref:Uncharacterized protein n=1 Tax=Tigriopus californicus TaxID=6832 RepID=A0A553NDR2_TIGCA|nr:multidrug resistance-associated protein 1-like [Tigriopus californicus]TRY63583.1 hypothetical protein TCAL_13931 [Tigriopus californicus]|eukprot:TCALIF_13931-PA protein Name:"Similar to ABCC1 Multidrug resistance-associated protein 1 (Canis familiaris)" AED:0.00 eAED:0.00 QI:0/-1/0/1/-1/1/1/0/1382